MIEYHDTYDKRWFLKDSTLYYEKDTQTYKAKNDKELDLLNPKDMCIGIIGDGCGGGRIFIADTGHDMIKVYEPENGEVFIIMQDISMPKSISKKGCILSIQTDDKHELIEFDLSSMTKSVRRT